MSLIARIAALAATVLSLTACATSTQHSDAVTYSFGDSVKSNLAIHTVNPSKKSMYKTSGLGKNGPVIVEKAADE